MKNWFKRAGPIRGFTSNWVYWFVTICVKSLPRKRDVSPSGSATTDRAQRSAGDLHNFAVAALTVGSGLGAQWADEHAPWVASAGVLSMALLSKRTYGRELRRVDAEVAHLNQQMSAVLRQVEEYRRKTQSGLATMAAISHEIRSPLSAVIALGDLLHQSSLPSEQQTMVRDLVDSSQMVMNVVNASLDYAKAESGALARGTQAFSLRSLLDRVRRQTEVLAVEKPGVAIEFTPSPIDWVTGDEVHLQQVLINLCTNAVKFTERGLVRVSADIQNLHGEDDFDLLVKVQDSGVGMSEGQIASLFQPYSQIHRNRTHSLHNTGLGLFISRRLMEGMGGTIAVTSEPGKGSEFTLTVPLSRAVRPQEPEAKSTTTAANTAPLTGLLIGIVDDARINREVTRRIVGAHGGQCALMDSGAVVMEEALSGRLKADILLLDIEMPGIGGLEVASRLRALTAYADLPIIAVSAVATDDISSALRNGHLNGFLPKPFHAHALVQKILAHLRA